MRDLSFTGYWEGSVDYTCDGCHKVGFHIIFTDEDEAKNYKEEKKKLRDNGWIITQVDGIWHEFCCEKCRNDFIRKNTI